MAGSTEMAEATGISPKEQERIRKAARQVVAFVKFLRWSTNFPRNEICSHPNHDRVMMLSSMQSARFAFGIDDDVLLLGVQDFEAVWFAEMPFTCAYISDRIYLSVDGTNCIGTKLPPLAIGIFVDDPVKCVEMSKARILRSVAITVRNGEVVSVGHALGPDVSILPGDIVQTFSEAQSEKLQKMDMRRYL